MTCHPWCKDIQRDEKVRADEDRRSGPLPTLAEGIAAMFPKSVSGSSPAAKTAEPVAWGVLNGDGSVYEAYSNDPEQKEAAFKLAKECADMFGLHGVPIAPLYVAPQPEPRHNGTELGHLLRSAQVTIPQEVKALDVRSQSYANGWNECLHHVKTMLAGKITVNQQTGTMKIRSEGAS